MKRFKAIYTLPLLAGLFFVSSCIRDEIPDCPPLTVKIAVKDKNYFNVDKVEFEERKSDDLALREYVPTLYWVLREAKTGKVVDESIIFDVEGNEKEVVADICPCIPHGKYVLTVWGGLDDTEPLGDDPTTIDFHPQNMEGRDIYMTNDTLVYDAWHNYYTVELERTKGKLIIEKVNLPEEIVSSAKTITGIYAGVNNEFKYTGETNVSKQSGLTPGAAQNITKTLLTPSLKKDGSQLSMNFLTETAARAAAYTPDDVKITMRRNELTVLRYEWDEKKAGFNIYILINDTWDLLNSLTID